MMRWLRRWFLLGALAGGGYSAYRAWLRKSSSPVDAPQWPPLATEPHAKPDAQPVKPSDSKTVEPAAATGAALVVAPDQLWVAPIDGTCPDGYPVKANDNSGIFHVPGGRFYARTVPERCYASADDAVAEGYRQAKA